MNGKGIKRIIVLAFLIIAGITAWYVYEQRESHSNELTLYGNVEIRQVDLSFQVSGEIAKMFKEEGDSVKKGELVAVLDERDYKANYEKSTAEVTRTNAISQEAQTLYDRRTPLCSDSTISKQECDSLTSNREATSAAHKSAVAARDYAKNQLDYSKVYAPVDGIITTRVQEPGAIIAPGQMIYTMAKNNPVWVRTYIPETRLGNIKYGMKAKVLTDSINPQTGKKREYVGWVGYISPVAEFTPKTVQTEDLRTDLVYRIRVYIFESDEFLRQGMPTTVKINLSESEVDDNIRSKIKESD